MALARDKRLHLAAGAAVGAVAFLVCASRSQDVFLAFWCAIVASAVVGTAKELWDWRHPPHVSDPMDFAATVAGGGLGGALTSLVLALLRELRPT